MPSVFATVSVNFARVLRLLNTPKIKGIKNTSVGDRAGVLSNIQWFYSCEGASILDLHNSASISCNSANHEYLTVFWNKCLEFSARKHCVTTELVPSDKAVWYYAPGFALKQIIYHEPKWRRLVKKKKQKKKNEPTLLPKNAEVS